MAPHTVVVLVLLGLAAVTVTFSGAGLVRAADPVARLHFLTPVTSIAAPLVGIAYLVDEGMGLAAGLVLLTCALLAVTGPPLSSAIGRVIAEEREMLPEAETR